MPPYRLAMHTPDGASLPDLTWYNGFDFSYGEMVTGFGTIVLDGTVKDANLWTPYSTLEVWRTVEGRTYLEGDRLWYLLDVEDQTDLEGRRLTTLNFADANYLLESRRILYAASSTAAEKTDYADDMLKEMVSQNLGAGATDTTRDASTWLTIAADLAAAPSITKAFSNRPLLTTMQEIAAQSNALGTYLTFDCVWTSTNTSQFRTYIGQRGTDRGKASASPLFVSWKRGNLRSPSLRLARMGRPTFVRAGGMGTNGDRIYEDASISTITALTRYEYFADCRNTGNDTASVYSEALSNLEQRQPAILFAGYLAESTNFRYGLDIHYGDKFVVDYGGYIFDARLRAVHFGLDQDGRETLELAVKNDD